MCISRPLVAMTQTKGLYVHTYTLIHMNKTCLLAVDVAEPSNVWLEFRGRRSHMYEGCCVDRV